MKIYNMLLKQYVPNFEANMNCLLIFKDRKEIEDNCGYFPANLPKITENDLENDSVEAIEDYLDRIENEIRERYEMERDQLRYDSFCHRKQKLDNIIKENHEK